ncbi:MAG: TRAP transporter small permease [Synergistaceae bacterium]|jgi:TRAP-type C4-dicarboxylate transport system permease small subunit|nr:TRAP transporter small permease [Synergistaceae bacterium]
MLKKSLERFLEWTSSLFFAGLIVVVLLQVFARMFLPRAPHWTEEASRFLMLYMVAFAAGLAAKERAYVNVDVFINFIRGRPRALIQLFIDVTIVVLMAATAWYGWKNAAIGRIQTSASLGIPMHLIFSSMVLHAGSVLLYTIALILEDFRALVTGEADYGNSAVS